MALRLKLSQYQSYSHGYGTYGPLGALGPSPVSEPRTEPWEQMVVPAELTHSADAGAANVIVTGTAAVASPIAR